jgi:hypothetical protein
MKQSLTRILFVVLFLAGCGMTALGVLYLTTPIEALPTFLGGIHHGFHAAYRTRRAYVFLSLGGSALVASAWLAARAVESLRERQSARSVGSSLPHPDRVTGP